MENKQRFYYPELDGLRFIAFLLVFIHNAPYLNSSKIWTLSHEYGWVGVDIFFCLSAFLITKLLLTEYNKTKHINIWFFYIRRILRIWPLYFFFIGIVFLLAIKQGNIEANTYYYFLALVFFTDNFATAFIGPNQIFYAVHLWTISYEEQFYFLIPWLVSHLASDSNKSKIILLGSMILTGNIIRGSFIFHNASHPIVYILPMTHFESILGGVAIGLGLLDQLFNRVSQWILFLGGIISLGLIIQLPNINIIGWHLILTYSLAGIGASLIIFASKKGGFLFWSKIAGNIYIVYLGKISYGLYIYHLGCLFIADRIYRLFMPTTQPVFYPIAMLVMGLLLAIIFAIASYQWIEKPFLSFKERFTLVSSRPA